MKSFCTTPILALGLLCAVQSASAADWPQYRGPQGDDTSPEKLMLKKWPQAGPTALWHTPLNNGFSSFAVKDGKAYTLVTRSIEAVPTEVCVALDASTGKELWSFPLGLAKYQGGGDTGAPDNSGGDGPRSTPSVDGNNVYVMSGQLHLDCLSASNGKEVWSKDIIKENHGRNISWQNAASPLIEGDLVLVAGGGAGEGLLGIDKHDGKVVWKGQDDQMTQSTPTAATIEGVRQVVFFTQPGLVSVEPKTGEVLWRFPFDVSKSVSTAISPVVGGNMVYCSNGYRNGSAVARITKDKDGFHAAELWKLPKNLLNSHWSTPVYKDGYLYGLFGFKLYDKCPLQCVEMATGKIVWSQDNFGPGGAIIIDNQLLVLGDRGQVVLADASPAGYVENARCVALTGKCWNRAVVANGRIYARSTKEGVCLDLTGRTASR